jgi:hypothetical protein
MEKQFGSAADKRSGQERANQPTFTVNAFAYLAVALAACMITSHGYTQVQFSAKELLIRESGGAAVQNRKADTCAKEKRHYEKAGDIYRLRPESSTCDIPVHLD